VPRISAAARPTREALPGGSKPRRRPAHDETRGASERNVGRKQIEEKAGRAAGAGATFIERESGGWPVHAPSPKQRAPNPGGANTNALDYIFNVSSSYWLDSYDITFSYWSICQWKPQEPQSILGSRKTGLLNNSTCHSTSYHR
jgi:hypothetical protein